MTSLTRSLHLRYARLCKRRAGVRVLLLVSMAMVTFLVVVWRPALLFGDPHFFLPRPSKQISLDYDYVHHAPLACAGTRGGGWKQRGPDLVILVLTTADHREQRDTIRETYGSLARGGSWPGNEDSSRPRGSELSAALSPRKPVSGKTALSSHHGSDDFPQGLSSTAPRIALVFLLGQAPHVQDREREARLLARESEVFGDVVQWQGLTEEYHHLTYKVLLGLRWVQQYCPAARYVVKTDDDAFLHLPRLLAYIRQAGTTPSPSPSPGAQAGQSGLKPSASDNSVLTPKPRSAPTDVAASFSSREVENVIYGSLCELPCGIVERFGKYGVPFHIYPFLTYPPYVGGNIYFMPVSLALRILAVAEHFPYNTMEDVHVTGILAGAVGAHHVGLRLPEQFDTTAGRFNFSGGVKIASRDVPTHMFKEIWKTL